MRQIPLFFNATAKRVLILGGGTQARQKVRLLAASPAELVVLADALEDGFAEEFEGRIELRPPGDLAECMAGAIFAIVAVESDELRASVVAELKAARLPVNVVDHPSLCDFTIPSILDRGDLVAAIGSGGAAPVLAKSLRTRLEALMPANIGALATLAGSLRKDVKAAIAEAPARRRFWERVLTGAPAERAYAGDLAGAEALMRQALKGEHTGGVVHIVGAGPGDPELLTLKALRLIQEADIVYYDRLVSDDILGLIRRDAERHAVGKSKGDHSVPQSEIEARLIASARAGQRVVRLKGGDPFIFGRGGEEVDAVSAAGIDVHVVPGISSVLGCAARARVPLTHRDHAQSLTLVTGHAKEGGVPDLDWPALAKRGQTVAVFMGVGTAATIAERLIDAGRAPETPVAIIENGTRPEEISAFGILEALPRLITEHGIEGPALLIIGEVAALAPGAIAARLKTLEIVRA